MVCTTIAWVFTCNAHARDPHPMAQSSPAVEHAFWLARFVLCRKISAWHFAVLVEDKCSWDDPSVQVSVLSVQTSLLLLLHGDRTRLTPETQQAMC